MFGCVTCSPSQKTGKKGSKAKKTQLKFTIDCSVPVEDEIMDAGAFVSAVGNLNLVLIIMSASYH